MQTVDFILLGVAFLLILLVIFQKSKDNIQDAFSGEKSELFKNQKQRGSELVLARITLITVFLFITLSIYATFIVQR